jgi:endonuclease/exonuclease/phosphatase family metal-dependent hydrolase
MVRLLVRTWNVFHGRSVPASGRAQLREMIELVTADLPALVCLQEVPVWALPRLEHWSGMRALPAVTARALGGPLARPLTARRPDLLRSGLAGQANAILVGDGLRLRETAALQLNPRAFRRRERRRLGLPDGTASGWGRNRRVAQLARVEAAGCPLVVVNLHLTSSVDSRPAEAELERALAFADGFARPGEPVVLCGDLNLTPASSTAFRSLSLAGFSRPLPGIDQIIARGLELAGPARRWPDEQRRRGAHLLSDHAPVEAEMMCG